MLKSPIRTVIFDFDYTLVDSSNGSVECINYALGRLGLPLANREAACCTIGLSLADTFLQLAGPEQIGRSAEFAALFTERGDQVMAENTALLPATRPTVAWLRRQGIAVGIVTNKFRYRVEEVLGREGLLDSFDAILGGEDVPERKPDPAGLLLAIGRLGSSAGDTLYVGDSVVDAETAQRAGVPFCAVLSGVTPSNALRAYAVEAILPILQDLPAWLLTRRLPRALLLDLDDTILADSEAALEGWNALCRVYAPRFAGLAEEDLFAAIEAIRAWFWSDPLRNRRGRLDLEAARREIVDLALRRSGVAAPDPALVAEMAHTCTVQRDRALHPFPGALETLGRWRERGAPLALITNGSAAAQRSKIERFGLAPLFDCLVIEGEFGAGKPNPRVFQYALDQLGAQPTEAWMIGDNLELDVAAAQSLGILGIWVDWAGKGLPGGSLVHPDRIVRSLAELEGPPGKP